MSNIKRFKDKDGDYIYPVTHASAVFDDDGKNLLEILQTISNDNINVKDFGAKGDGVTDDTASIQEAITYAKDNGVSKIVIDTGKYMVTSINIYSNMCIELHPNVKIKSSSDTKATFVCDSVANVIITGGDISGGYGAIRCNESENVIVKNMNIHDTQNGIMFVDSNKCFVINNIIKNITGNPSGSIGVSIDKTDNALIDGNYIDTTGQDSILLYDNANYCVVSNNICVDWNRENDMGRAGIQAYWTSHVNIHDNMCYNVNHLEFDVGKNETGIRARDCDYIKIDNNHVENCYATGIESILLNDSNGLYNQKHVTITNNTIVDVGQYGILSMSTTTSITPEYCIISNNIVDTVKWMYTNGSGVGIFSQGDNNIISNNIVRKIGDIGISTSGKTKIMNNIIENIGMYNDENVGVNGVGIFTKSEGAEILFNTISHTLPVEECNMKKGIIQFGEVQYSAFGNILNNNLTENYSGTNLIQ